jgi:hypothetical protein
MVTTVQTTQPIVTNDMNKIVMAVNGPYYDSFAIEWFICSSVYSFQPMPGTGARKVHASGGEDVLNKPCGGDGLSLLAGAFDPLCDYVIEFDVSQIASCSCTYSYGRRIPAINLNRCKGAVLRNIRVMSNVQTYYAGETCFGFVGETTGSTGIAFPLQITELITASVSGSLIGGFPLPSQNTSGSTCSLIYLASSQSTWLGRNPAKLIAKYYTLSLTTEHRLVMEVL